MNISYPQDFNCYDFFQDMTDKRVNELIDELIGKLKDNPRLSLIMKNCENTGILIIKERNRETKESAFKVIVMKNHWEKRIPLSELGIEDGN